MDDRVSRGRSEAPLRCQLGTHSTMLTTASEMAETCRARLHGQSDSSRRSTGMMAGRTGDMVSEMDGCQGKGERVGVEGEVAVAASCCCWRPGLTPASPR